MKRPPKAGSADVRSDAGPGIPTKRRIGKGSAKSVRNTRKSASFGDKVKQLAAKKSDQGSGIREAEEARALLEDQLHSLYWWVFNACKMKGFIRANALGESHRADGNDSETVSEQRDFTEPHISPKTQTP